ncbi:MAG: hypothetical protein IAF38_07510 [Bacteroidia bacterium]|nr:hypothetical protein [Bacteroidia bacterium]
MKKRLKIFFVILFLISVCSSNCFSQLFIQTQSYNTGKTFDEIPRTDYMGTFSAIYFLQQNKNINIDPELSKESVYVSDSIIKCRVKKVNHAGNLIADSMTILQLRNELTDVIKYAQKNESIKGYKPDSVFYRAGSKSVTNYNLYFVSTGFIKDSALHRKAVLRKIGRGAIIVSFGLLGYFATQVFHEKKDDPLPPGIKRTEGKNPFKGTSGLSGFVIIYDKKNNQICFYRQQFFLADRDPTNEENIVKQIRGAFKENFIDIYEN